MVKLQVSRGRGQSRRKSTISKEDNLERKRTISKEKVQSREKEYKLKTFGIGTDILLSSVALGLDWGARYEAAVRGIHFRDMLVVF